MPKRNNIQRIVTGTLQGEDSWIEIKSMTVGQYQRSLDITRKITQAVTDGDEDLIKELDTESRQIYAECVLDWNWVDDSDQPLPKPLNNPDVFNLLSMNELAFIGTKLRPFESMEAEKKREEITETVMMYLATRNAVDPQSQTARPLPWAYQQLRLCRDVYHCTPSQLDEQDWETVLLHIMLMNVENEVRHTEHEFAHG